MTPADIDAVEFKTTRIKEGYDPDEVDAFLDRVRDQWGDTCQSLGECREELARVQRKLADAQRIADAIDMTAPIPAPSPAESATRILEFAQRTADEVMADARQQADALVSAAQGKAYAIEREVQNFERKRDEVKAHLRDFHRKNLNELEETGG